MTAGGGNVECETLGIRLMKGRKWQSLLNEPLLVFATVNGAHGERTAVDYVSGRQVILQ